MKEKIKKIKLVLTDVDGVLTDGGMYYTEQGQVMKRFNVKDGMGVVRLQKAGFEVGIISTDKSKIIQARGEKLKLNIIRYGVKDKKETLLEICKKKHLSPEEVAFVGDDVNDISIIETAGFTACPNDSFEEIKKMVDYVCKSNGGYGAFREFAELIIKERL